MKKDSGFDEFKLLVESGRHFFDLYLKAVGLYFAVLGILLKLFFDAPSGTPGRWAFFLLGFVVNLSAVILTAVGGGKYLRMAKRGDEVSESLGIPNVYFPGPVATARGFLALLSTLSLLWLGLLFLL